MGIEFLGEDPPGVVAQLVIEAGAPVIWAMDVIPKAETGDPALAAYKLRSCGLVPEEWAKDVIGRASIGDPGRAAYYMACDGFASSEWAQNVLLRTLELGDPAETARLMFLEGLMDIEQVREVVSSARSGDPALVAYVLASDHRAAPYWARSVIAQAVVGDPASAAYGMVRDGLAEPAWAMGVISWCAMRQLGDPIEAARKLIALDRVQSNSATSTDRWLVVVEHLYNGD